MTTIASPTTNLKLNYNNRDYEFEELPHGVQLLLQDLMRMDQRINELQFELRHLQAAKQIYSINLQRTMREQENTHAHPGGDGEGTHEGG
jgi:seryl-tRNA synthetase